MTANIGTELGRMPQASLLTPDDSRGLVWDCWRRHADRTPDRDAVIHWRVGQPAHRWSWAQLIDAVPPIAARLIDAGVRPGDVCALIIRHHPSFYPTYMAVSAIGALPAVLAYPNDRLHPDKFRDGLEGMSRRSGLDWVLTERALEERTAPLVLRKDSTVKGLIFPFEWPLERANGYPLPRPPGVDASSPCLLQHSSGTTGLQKAVVLSHRAVIDHIRLYGSALQLNGDDRIVSWLPLYHDMGLIAVFYLSLLSGIPYTQLDPFEWVMAPQILLEAISAERATVSWLPNFAYSLMAERIKEDDIQGIRLDSVRLLVNCSEPVRAHSQSRFFERFASVGFKRQALGASYAMAETTMAITQTRPGVEAGHISVDREALAQGRVELSSDPQRSRVCVSSGAPIEGCRLRVVDDQRQDLPAGSVGELLVQSVSMFDGYRNYPEKTAEVLKDNWLATGDIGFSHDGEYYVIGRKKDLVIVAGKNLYPEDIEDVVGRVEGILAGRVVAFGLEDEASGTEQACVIAETTVEDETKWKALRRSVVAAAMAIDVTISRVYLVPPRWLIKSSSGKPARKANSERVGQLSWR